MTQKIFVVGLRHQGIAREILVLKATGEDFYAFPPYAKRPLGDTDNHVSRHQSGERHCVSRVRNSKGEWQEGRLPDGKTVREQTRVELEPLSSFVGVELWYGSPILLGQFIKLRSIGTNDGELTILDADAAGFRDDFIAVKSYIVEPGREHEIPVPADVGPRILYLIKETKPWLAVDVFQQCAPGGA